MCPDFCLILCYNLGLQNINYVNSTYELQVVNKLFVNHGMIAISLTEKKSYIFTNL